MNDIVNINDNNHILASNDNVDNEKKFFDILNLSMSDSFFAVPVPKTIYGKNLNWLSFLPTMGEIIPLADWRTYIQQWENEFHVAMTRVLDDEHVKDMEAKIAKYWHFARRRYPELEDALTLNVPDLLNTIYIVTSLMNRYLRL